MLRWRRRGLLIIAVHPTIMGGRLLPRLLLIMVIIRPQLTPPFTGAAATVELYGGDLCLILLMILSIPLLLMMMIMWMWIWMVPVGRCRWTWMLDRMTVWWPALITTSQSGSLGDTKEDRTATIMVVGMVGMWLRLCMACCPSSRSA